LKINQEMVTKHIMPQGYDKPKIEVGNYYLKWNKKSCGIPQKEISELKLFLRLVAPYFDKIYQLLNNLERPRNREKYRLAKELCPDMHVSHSSKGSLFKYDLYMTTDGSTFIDRTEKIEIIKVHDQFQNEFASLPSDADSELFLKWRLGELLFNRHGNL
jgi:hypothetical protein